MQNVGQLVSWTWSCRALREKAVPSHIGTSALFAIAHRHAHAVRARVLLLTAHDRVGVVRVVVRVDQRAHLAVGGGNVENPGADQ